MKRLTPKAKKIISMIVYIFIALLANYWCFYLMWYYSATIDGPVFIEGDYLIFERNYIVPALIFGITAVFTTVSVILYRKLRKKQLIGILHLIPITLGIIFLLLISFFQVNEMIAEWDKLYK